MNTMTAMRSLNGCDSRAARPMHVLMQFLQALNLRKVHIWDYSRLNLMYTLMSKVARRACTAPVSAQLVVPFSASCKA